MNAKLRLGPLPDQKPTKLMVTLPATLRSELEEYAKLHSLTWGQTIDVATLIPHIVDAFITRDRQFKRLRKSNSEAVS